MNTNSKGVSLYKPGFKHPVFSWSKNKVPLV